MSIAEQMAMYLSTEGAGLYTSDSDEGNIYIDQLSEKTNVIGLYNKAGAAERVESYRKIGIQLLYRGDTNPIESYMSAEHCFSELQGFHGKFIPLGNFIVSCFSQSGGGPEGIGQDQNGNFEYSINFIVEFKFN